LSSTADVLQADGGTRTRRAITGGYVALAGLRQPDAETGLLKHAAAEGSCRGDFLRHRQGRGAAGDLDYDEDLHRRDRRQILSSPAPGGLVEHSVATAEGAPFSEEQ